MGSFLLQELVRGLDERPLRRLTSGARRVVRGRGRCRRRADRRRCRDLHALRADLADRLQRLHPRRRHRAQHHRQDQVAPVRHRPAEQGRRRPPHRHRPAVDAGPRRVSLPDRDQRGDDSPADAARPAAARRLGSAPSDRGGHRREPDPRGHQRHPRIERDHAALARAAPTRHGRRAIRRRHRREPPDRRSAGSRGRAGAQPREHRDRRT